MMLKVVENTVETKESSGTAFGLQGDLFIIPVVGILLSIGLFAILLFSGGRSPVYSFIISLIPAAAATAFTYAFLNNKPPHDLGDKIESFMDGGTFKVENFNPPTKASPYPNTNKFRDCWFVKKLIVFNEADNRGYVSKGYYVSPPSLNGMSIKNLNDIHDRLESFLANVKHPVRMQWDWSLSTDFNEELDHYDADTEKYKKKNWWSHRIRKQVSERFRRLQRENILKKERLAVYFSIQLSGEISVANEINLIDSQLAVYGNGLSSLFSLYNCEVTEMEDRDYFNEYIRTFNPSLSYQARNKIEFDPQKSALEQCTGGEILDTKNGFRTGGTYHTTLAIRALPKTLSPGMVVRLLSLNINEYSITVNIIPLNSEKELKKEEALIQRLEGDMQGNKKQQYSININRQKKIAKVEALAEGRINPMRCEFIIKVSAKDENTLKQRIAIIKEAAAMTNGVILWEANSARSTRNLFFQTAPGWCFGNYSGFAFYTPNDVMACMIPFSSSFSGKLKTAEALYDGADRNIVGVSTFQDNSPQHSVILGTTGCGKSAFLIDLLSQTAPFYDYTCIIEEGMSYYFYSLTQDSKPLVIHPDAGITFNYFDLGGLPLSASHISFCSNLLMNMIGYSGDSDKDTLREAIISKYVQQQYSEVFETWSKDSPEMLPELARRCILAQKNAGLEPFIDAYIELEKNIKAKDEKTLDELSKITEKEITAYLTSPLVQRVEQAAFCHIPKSYIPDHSAFINLIQTFSFAEKNHNPDEIKRIIASLEAWGRTGPYGSIFDGETNIQFTGRHVHFELGSIPESALPLKKMIAFLILNIVRQHIILLPRNMRKRVVFEEIARFLQVEGAGKLIEECYAQFRKYSSWVICANQNYGLFKKSPIKSTVMSNSKQHFVMRQNDADDVDDFSQTVPVPESLKGAILTFPLPESLPANNKYSSFLYNFADKNMYSAGIAYNVASKDMLLCASTSGESFDKAKKIFQNAAKDGSSIEKVFAENEKK